MNSCLVLVAELDGKHVLTVGAWPGTAACIPCRRRSWRWGCPVWLLHAGDAPFWHRAAEPVPPIPTREQIRKEMEGNICRCTGYACIADAIQLAAERINGKALSAWRWMWHGISTRAASTARNPPCGASLRTDHRPTSGGCADDDRLWWRDAAGNHLRRCGGCGGGHRLGHWPDRARTVPGSRPRPRSGSSFGGLRRPSAA